MAGITYEVDDKAIVEQIRNDAMNAATRLQTRDERVARNLSQNDKIFKAE